MHITYKYVVTTEDCNQMTKMSTRKTVLYTDSVQLFVYKCALHSEKARLHKMLSLMRAL